MTLQSRVCVTLAATIAAFAMLQALPYSQSADPQPNPYHELPNHFKLPEGRTLGSTAAIDIDRDGRSVWVFERCGGTSQGLACIDSSLAPILE